MAVGSSAETQSDPEGEDHVCREPAALHLGEGREARRGCLLISGHRRRHHHAGCCVALRSHLGQHGRRPSIT